MPSVPDAGQTHSGRVSEVTLEASRANYKTLLYVDGIWSRYCLHHPFKKPAVITRRPHSTAMSNDVNAEYGTDGPDAEISDNEVKSSAHRGDPLAVRLRLDCVNVTRLILLQAVSPYDDGESVTMVSQRTGRRSS